MTGSGARLLSGGSLARKVIAPTAEAGDLCGSSHGIRFTDEAFDDLATIQGGAADSERWRHGRHKTAETIFRHGPHFHFDSGSREGLVPNQPRLGRHGAVERIQAIAASGPA